VCALFYSRGSRPEGKQSTGGLDDYSVLDVGFYSSNSLYCFGHLIGVESRNGIERAEDSDYSGAVVGFSGGVSFYSIICLHERRGMRNAADSPNRKSKMAIYRIFILMYYIGLHFAYNSNIMNTQRTRKGMFLWHWLL